MSRLDLLYGRIRLAWGFCPACNSDAPECDSCPVCLDWYGRNRPASPSEQEKREWWGRFTAPPAPTVNGGMIFREHWLRRSWRFILQAYYRHQDTQDPENVLLVPSRTPPTIPGVTPQETLPIYAKDALYTRVTITISFLDLLRCLLGCKLHVDSVTYCQNPPGACKTEAQAFATFD